MKSWKWQAVGPRDAFKTHGWNIIFDGRTRTSSWVVAGVLGNDSWAHATRNNIQKIRLWLRKLTIILNEFANDDNISMRHIIGDSSCSNASIVGDGSTFRSYIIGRPIQRSKRQQLLATRSQIWRSTAQILPSRYTRLAWTCRPLALSATFGSSHGLRD